jgi:hypothetical protein
MPTAGKNGNKVICFNTGLLNTLPFEPVWDG